MSDENNEFIDVVEDLGLDDPTLGAWDGQTWSPVPAGEYVLAVKEAKRSQSKKGDPYVVITFDVASEGEAFGREIRHQWYALDKKAQGFGRLVQLVRALGVQTLPGGGLSIASMVGLMCVAEVTVESSTYFSTKKNAQVTGENNKVCNERSYDQPKAAPAPPTVAAATNGKPARAAVGTVARK